MGSTDFFNLKYPFVRLSLWQIFYFEAWKWDAKTNIFKSLILYYFRDMECSKQNQPPEPAGEPITKNA